MSGVMKHRGYVGSVDYDAEGKVLHGRLLGIGSVITYEGESVAALEDDFKAAVDDYLTACVKSGREPERPYSGKFMVRAPGEVHASLAAAARRRGVSLNELVVEILENAAV